MKFKNLRMTLPFLIGTFCICISSVSKAQTGSISISINKQEILMGQHVVVNTKFIAPSEENPSDYILLPFVERKRWGAHEFPNESGEVSFMIPLPNIGYADIEVIAVKRTTNNWQGLEDISLLRTGTSMPDVDLVSNKEEVQILWRDFPKKKQGKSVFAMQWEPWFTPGWAWNRAQAIPLFGFYDCTNPDVLRQQVLWMIEMGINSIVVDWSNHIWGAKHWTDRGSGADQIVHITQLFLEVLADMRDQGLPVPLVSLMPGLTNGPPATMVALNEELEWIYQDYVRNPRFKGLWQMWEEKPLVIILDTGVLGDKEGRTESAFQVPFFKQTLTLEGATEGSIDEMRQNQPDVDDSHFSIRWMSSQNQLTEHNKFGYWSWMDGSLKPITTYKDGKAEAITVCTALFPKDGWKAAGAYGKRNGWTYLKSIQEAEKTEPRFIMLHQYNEYAGQAEGKGYGENKNIFVDSYSVELCDEIEPVSLTAPGYRGDQGGWGFFFQNITKAIIAIYNREVTNATILTVSIPQVTEDKVTFEWTTIGKKAESFTVFIDNKVVAKNITAELFVLEKRKIAAGNHTIKVQANGVTTQFELSKHQMDEVLSESIPVIVEENFLIE